VQGKALSSDIERQSRGTLSCPPHNGSGRERIQTGVLSLTIL